MATFAERLKSLRREKGWSQQRLADELDLSKSSVNMYERGEREPGFETMEAIADLFNVDMNYLYGRTDAKDEEDPADRQHCLWGTHHGRAEH